MIHEVSYGGERLDRIAKKLLQTEQRGAVEALLSANPGLAAVMEAGIVPAGTEIVVPNTFQPADTARLVLAWE